MLQHDFEIDKGFYSLSVTVVIRWLVTMQVMMPIHLRQTTS